MPSDEYPPVTASTIRSLYGAAYRCAHPDCRRPLYNVDGESGDRVLNSRVAHIHARRRGGARWIDMPAEENRNFDNLLLLCTQHSYEIDDFPDRFPAEMLREWKAAQIREYDQIHSWPLTDSEAEEVLTASEDEPVWSTLELVRKVEAVRLTAQRTRTATRAAVTSWQELRKRTQAGFLGWDDDGNDVVVEPAPVEVEPIKRRIVATLAAADKELTPKVEAARVELAAARAAHPQLQAWGDDLGRHLVGLQQVAAVWQGGSDPDDDDAFNQALAGVETSIGGLLKRARGEAVTAPEPPPEEPRAAEADAYAEHLELLQEGRPHHRVDNRPFDPDLRYRLAAATAYAMTLPRTISSIAVDVDATAELAVAVSRNAGLSEQLRLVDEDARREPLAAAVALLFATARRSDAPTEVIEAARRRALDLLGSTDWEDSRNWTDELLGGPRTFNELAALTSGDTVAAPISDALAARPELVRPILIACAQWSEQVDRQTWQTTGFTRRYREEPTWLPVSAIRAAATQVDPDTAFADLPLQHLLDWACC
jgi:hypothetical protein